MHKNSFLCTFLPLFVLFFLLNGILSLLKCIVYTNEVENLTKFSIFFFFFQFFCCAE